MALKPRDLVLSSSEIAEADALEVKIDEVLRREFVSGEECVVIISDLTPYKSSIHKRIRRELVRRYNKAGWRTHDDTNIICFNQK